jgi:hypothetical protein
MPDFDPVLEQKLADLSDVDWAALTARVRPPSSSAQLREIAGKVITGDQLEAFVNVANVKALAGSNGDIDEAKVMGALTGMFGVSPETSPPHENFGQYSPPPPMPGPGDCGRAEAAKRFGANGENVQGARGGGGRAEAERRFGRRKS